MNKYAAFLRGINVGGNKLIKMEDLRKAFETMGFKNVKTILASGNVIFEASEKNQSKLAVKIEIGLKEKFNTNINILIRSISDIKILFDSNPFNGIKLTPDKRFYVTFLGEKGKSSLKIPYSSPDKNFRILSKSDNEVISVLKVSKEYNTLDLMSIIEKEFGKKITTRNWNTVLKILSVN